jgi:hypothetical protein
VCPRSSASCESREQQAVVAIMFYLAQASIARRRVVESGCFCISRRTAARPQKRSQHAAQSLTPALP